MVTIIGNRLNSANKKILDRMNKKDFDFIRREAIQQLQQGAEFVEVNAVSLLHNEIPFLKEAIPVIEATGAKVMLISENIDTLVEILNISTREMIVGAIEYDKSKIDAVLEPVREKKAKIVALIREKTNNNPFSPERSLLIAQQYIDYLLDRGMRRQDILLDPAVQPIEEDFSNGRTFLDTLELFKLDFPQVRTMATIGQLSEGLPKRNVINSYFLSLALARGLDYVVTNVLDEAIKEAIIVTFSIIGKDKHLQSLLKYCRNHKENRPVKGNKNGRSENKRNSARPE